MWQFLDVTKKKSIFSLISIIFDKLFFFIIENLKNVRLSEDTSRNFSGKQLESVT